MRANHGGSAAGPIRQRAIPPPAAAAAGDAPFPRTRKSSQIWETLSHTVIQLNDTPTATTRCRSELSVAPTLGYGDLQVRQSADRSQNGSTAHAHNQKTAQLRAI